MFGRGGTREGRNMNPHVVPPSQHTVFMRGFHPNTEMNKIRDFFTKEGGKCSFDFFKVSQDGTRLFVALRFESKDVAKEILSRYDNATVLGSKITITWFKDLRRARLKAMQHGQRWNNFYGGHMKNGYGRGGGGGGGGGGYMHNKFGNRMKSAVWRQSGKFHDEHRRSTSSSRSYSRSRSRSKSRSRSHSRSRSWSRSRSRERSVSPRHYRSRSSSSSRASGSDKLKKRSWKNDTSQKNEQYGAETGEKGGETATKTDGNAQNEAEGKKNEGGTVGEWQPKKNDSAQEVTGPKSPANSPERPASRSVSRSSSASSHGKERKKKKKKHHRSKHRRHRRRHRHQRDSTDEEGQLSDYEEGERSPSPDQRRFKKRRRHSSSSSQDSQSKMRKNENKNMSSSVFGPNDIKQNQMGDVTPEMPPLESDIHSIKSQRSLDAPSQVSDGMSPLHVSEGDDEVTPNMNFNSISDQYGIHHPGNQDLSAYTESQLRQKTDDIDRQLSATRDELVKKVHDITAAVTASSRSNTLDESQISGVKQILDRFKSTMKPVGGSTTQMTTNQQVELEKAVTPPLPPHPPPSRMTTSTPQIPRRDEGSRSFNIDHYIPPPPTQMSTPSRYTMVPKEPVAQNDLYDPEESSLIEKPENEVKSTGDGGAKEKEKRSCLMDSRRAIRSDALRNDALRSDTIRSEPTTGSLSNDKIKLINRKRAELESAYRQDCETFATVVKMLIRKDTKLEEYIQDSLRQNLHDIGMLCIEELKQFIEVVMSEQ